MNKVALITGTSTGLGLSLAVKMSQQGFKVYATMRDLSKANKLQQQAAEKNLGIEIYQLDVQDNASIQKCVEKALFALIVGLDYAFLLNGELAHAKPRI